MYIAVNYFSKWTELFENTKKKKVGGTVDFIKPYRRVRPRWFFSIYCFQRMA